VDEHDKQWLSMALSLVLIAFTLFIVHRFIPSLIWGGIITIATYPLYQRWQSWFGNHANLSAFLFTLMVVTVVLAPCSWLIRVLVVDSQIFLGYLQQMNRSGADIPVFLNDIPWLGQEIKRYWDGHLGSPGALKHTLSHLNISLTPFSYYIKQVSFNLLHRSIQIGFTLLIIFFFYRDGHLLTVIIHRIGNHCLGQRWDRYAKKLPAALRGTVNGTLVVALGVGLLMGLCYALLGVSAPTLLGLVTAAAAVIPFLAPLVFTLVAFFLWCHGGVMSAITVLVWGSVVLFIADHLIKPVLIGGSIQLPFLAVLFGILGGVETLGLLGLFVGPMVMVLFVTLCQELQGIKNVEGRYRNRV